MKILNVEYHRNGSHVCEGFFAVLFEDKKPPKEWDDKTVCGDKFIATFRTNDDTSEKIKWESMRVINVHNFNLNFRGDHYINDLERAIVDYCNSKDLRESNFSAAAFPDQYQKEELTPQN